MLFWIDPVVPLEDAVPQLDLQIVKGAILSCCSGKVCAGDCLSTEMFTPLALDDVFCQLLADAFVLIFTAFMMFGALVLLLC